MLVGVFSDELWVPPGKEKRPWHSQLRREELCDPAVCTKCSQALIFLRLNITFPLRFSSQAAA